ncbi:MAG: CDP-diacylglycerol--serine O-phosphatidyltransferase [Rhodospirillaceae bacterium]|nr:CDP-diacylglycerol--serine O-phosphatidyltransferase [Rhodospirillaceae bacterium]
MAPDDAPHSERSNGPHDERARGLSRVGGAVEKRFKSLSFNRILPNMITLLAMCAGLTAIRYGLSAQWDKAVLALVFAIICDGIDGRVARMLRGTSKFGAELDSLADAINFGVVPAMLVYLWAMQDAGRLGWALCLLHAVCCVLRLARFNTMIGQPDLPPWAHSYFTGVPAPAGAGIAILPLILSLETDIITFNSPFLVGGFLIVSASLMVSRVPTYSLKNIRIKPQAVLFLMLLVGVIAAFLVTDPWATLAGVGFIYLASIPVSVITYRRLERRDATAVPTAAA